MATVTIVDEISRVAKLLLEDVIDNDHPPTEWNNRENLIQALKIIANNATS